VFSITQGMTTTQYVQQFKYTYK